MLTKLQLRAGLNNCEKPGSSGAQAFHEWPGRASRRVVHVIGLALSLTLRTIPRQLIHSVYCSFQASNDLGSSNIVYRLLTHLHRRVTPKVLAKQLIMSLDQTQRFSSNINVQASDLQATDGGRIAVGYFPTTNVYHHGMCTPPETYKKFCIDVMLTERRSI
jgi:hypothetical protein